MLLYYITDRTQFSGGETERRERLLKTIAEATRCGVDYIQLREKDLSVRDLETLAREAMESIRAAGEKTRLLINSRSDVALAVGAHGVHLKSKDVSAEEARGIWRGAGDTSTPLVTVSCHTAADVQAAEESGAELVVFGPVFEKKGAPDLGAAGVELLRGVCKGKIPVFALGGVTTENARMCRNAGVKGVAGIRLFQQNNLAEVVAKLRN